MRSRVGSQRKSLMVQDTSRSSPNQEFVSSVEEALRRRIVCPNWSLIWGKVDSSLMERFWMERSWLGRSLKLSALSTLSGHGVLTLLHHIISCYSTSLGMEEIWSPDILSSEDEPCLSQFVRYYQNRGYPNLHHRLQQEASQMR